MLAFVDSVHVAKKCDGKPPVRLFMVVRASITVSEKRDGDGDPVRSSTVVRPSITYSMATVRATCSVIKEERRPVY